jgi:tRNA A37 threonylcarbamoyladenosine synthetase subunit TsaC/SUA5/YrdC
MLRLVERVGEPLVSTSVNRSGLSPLNRIGDIIKAFPGIDAYISRKGSGCRKPSTVIDLTGSKADIVRPGSIAGLTASAFGED